MIFSVIIVLIVIFLIFSSIGWWVYFNQSRMLYRPKTEIKCNPLFWGLGLEEVSFRSADGVELSGWYIKANNSDFTVLFCHGNAGNISHRIDTISFFHKMGLNCFLFDYRGYGKSKGKPHEKGTYLDAEAAYLEFVR